MIIEIECYKGDTLLDGHAVTFDVFRKQVKDIKLNYDRKIEPLVYSPTAITFCRTFT